VLAEYLKKMK